MRADRAVLLVTGDAGRELRALVEGWTGAGLLTESLWVQAEDVTAGAGPPRVPARLVAAGAGRDGDLFDLLGLQRLDLVRLVAVQLVTRTSRPPAAFLARADLVADVLQAAMPLPPAGTRVHRVSLVVAESGARGLGREHLLPGWDVAAVVAAEDRPDLDRSTVFVREPGNFLGHAAAAAAAVGGLWSGVSEGALDGVRTDSTSTEGDLVVLRASLRAVLGPDPVEEVVRDAIALATTEAGPAPALTWARPPRDPAAVAQRAARFLLDRGDWRPPPRPAPPGPQRRVRRVRAALWEALRFNLMMFRVGFGVLARGLRRLVENVATAVLVGRDSDTLVRTRTRRADSLFDVVREAAAAGRAGGTAAPEDTGARPSGPDGGAAGLPSPPGSGSAEARDGVPAPRAQTWQDLRRVCFALVDGGDLPPGLPAPELAGLRELLPPAAVAPPDAGADRRGGEARGQQPSTLTGRLTEALDARIAALDAAGAVPNHADPDAMAQAERRLKRRWLVALVLLVVAVVATAVYLAGHPSAAGATRAVTLTLSIPLVLAVSAQHGYYRALRRHAWTAATEDEASRARAESADDVRRERVRLALLREALTEWCEIVGHLVHRPWAPVEAGPPKPPADVLATLPAAVALGAVTGTAEAEHERAVHAALATLCHPGWCAENFDELVAGVGDGARRSPGGYLAADLDVRGGPFAPRRRLVEACRAGRGGALATRRALAEVRQAVERGRLPLADRHVERLGPLAGGTVTESAFFRAAHGLAVPFAPDQWSPRGLQGARHLPETALTWVRPAPEPGESGVGEAGVGGAGLPGRLTLRVDLSPRAQPGDLVLFAPAPSRAPAPAAPSPATAEREFIEW